MIFNKGANIIEWREKKMFYETNSAGATCYPHANEQSLYIDLPKEKFKIDKWPKSKSENNKTLRRKHRENSTITLVLASKQKPTETPKIN